MPFLSDLQLNLQGTSTATSYTQAIVPASGPTPASATLTYTLNAPAPAGGIVITPSSAHGTYSPTTVTILAGNTTGSTGYTNSTLGVDTISSTNNISLPNPGNITFDVLAANLLPFDFSSLGPNFGPVGDKAFIMGYGGPNFV